LIAKLPASGPLKLQVPANGGDDGDSVAAAVPTTALAEPAPPMNAAPLSEMLEIACCDGGGGGGKGGGAGGGGGGNGGGGD